MKKQSTVQNEKEKLTSSGMGKTIQSKMDSTTKSELRTDKTDGNSMYDSVRGTSTMMSAMDRTRMWWTQKPPKRRRIITIQIGVILGCMVLLLLAIIAAGFYFLQRWKEQMEMDRVKLKTRLEQCRNKYFSSYPRPCIFENEERCNNCTPSDHCIVQEWNVSTKWQNKIFIVEWRKLVKYLPLNVTESVDCGVGKWCEEKCSPVKGKWWNRKDGPFDKEPDDVQRSEENVACIKLEPTAQFQLNEFLMNRYKTCNKDVCKNPGATYEIAINLISCDKQPSYGNANGDRSRPCHPIKVYAC